MTNQENQNQENQEQKPNFDIIQEQFILLGKEFKACNYFIEDCKEIKDKNSFRYFFQKYFEDIADKFGCDIADADEIDELEDKIDDLESEICKLENELDDYKDRFGINSNWLSEEYKTKFFMEHKEKYTEWQLQYLLENGTQFLNVVN
jgi:hypothetical protein